MKRLVPRIAAVLLLVVAGALVPAAAADRPSNNSGADKHGDKGGTLCKGDKGCPLNASGADKGNKQCKAAKVRPFYASGAGVVAGDLYASEFEATHLGQSSLFVGSMIPLDSYLQFYPYSATLTSASGDKLYFQFDAEYYLLGYTEDETIFPVNATVTFTGGTGRFQNATGSADMTINFSPEFFYFDFVMDGTINY